MAKPLPNENELYAKIKEERITVASAIWDLLYNHLGDDLTAINLICKYALNNQEPLSIAEARKILHHTRHIKDLMAIVTGPEAKGLSFPELIENPPLHPVALDMFTHYIGNDIHAINLIVGDSLDRLAPAPLSIERLRKVAEHTYGIREFLEKLRIATFQEENPSAKQDSNRRAIKNLTKEQVFLKMRKSLADEFKMDEEKIKLSSSFQEDLGLDSVDRIRVVLCLGEAFNLEISDEASDSVLTISEAVDYISKRLEES